MAPVGPNNQVLEKFIDRNVRVSYLSQNDEEPDQCSVSIGQMRVDLLVLNTQQNLVTKCFMGFWSQSPPPPTNQRFVGIAQTAKQFGIKLDVMEAPSLAFLTGE